MPTAAARSTRIAALKVASVTRPRILRPPASASPLCLGQAVVRRPWHLVMCCFLFELVVGEHLPVDASFVRMLLPSVERRGQEQ